jgi:DNA-binding protein Fis
MGKDAAPLLPRVKHALIARVLQAEGGDHAKAAQRLGLTKAALKKRLAEPEAGA